MNLKAKLRTMLISSISIAAVAFPTVSFPQVSAPAPVKLSAPVSVPIQTYTPPVLTTPIKFDPAAVMQIESQRFDRDMKKFNIEMNKWTEERDRRFNPQMVIPSPTPSLGYQPYQPPIKLDSDATEALLKAVNSTPANTFNPNYKVDPKQVEIQQCIQKNPSLLCPYDGKGIFKR
jgi:hypothetical protein